MAVAVFAPVGGVGGGGAGGLQARGLFNGRGERRSGSRPRPPSCVARWTTLPGTTHGERCRYRATAAAALMS